MSTFKLTIGSSDDFSSVEELMDPEQDGNRSTFEVELDSSTVPNGFKSLGDFAQTILFGMAFQESWCNDDVITNLEVIESGNGCPSGQPGNKPPRYPGNKYAHTRSALFRQ